MTENNNNIPIIIWADIVNAPLGQKSKLMQDLAGKVVLTRTLERVCPSKRASSKIVYCRPEQAEQIKPLIDGLDVDLKTIDFNMPGWWPGLQSARKWAMSSWRGGLLGACAFDEDILSHVLYEIAKVLNVEAVMIVSAHACWVDPKIIDSQIEQYIEHKEEWKLNFTQAPPGLSGLILHIDVLDQLRKTSKLAGQVVSYHPTSARPDLIGKPCNTPIDGSVIKTPVRFTCDTLRSLKLANKLAERLDPLNASAEQIAQVTKSELMDIVNGYPKDIELEIYDGWPWPKGLRKGSEGKTGPKDVTKEIEKIADIAKHVDDLTVFIGGNGDPINHPQLEQIIVQLKQAGVFGIGLQTSAVCEKETMKKLARLDIDIINVLIDVPDPHLYHEIMGIDAYSTVMENIETLIETLHSLRRPIPLVIPEMIKTDQTLDLMDKFYDSWFRRVGWAVIRKIS